MKTYMSTHEAAEKMGLSIRKVQEMCRYGKLPGTFKRGKNGPWQIPLSSVETWVKNRKPEQRSSGGGDHITISGVQGSVISVGRESKVEIHQTQKEATAELFTAIYDRIQQRKEDPIVEKPEITDTVEKIQEEITKGDEANPKKVERWLKTLGLMAPDILEVTAATLANPAAGIAAVIRKVAQKAAEDTG